MRNHKTQLLGFSLKTDRMIPNGEIFIVVADFNVCIGIQSLNSLTESMDVWITLV